MELDLRQKYNSKVAMLSINIMLFHIPVFLIMAKYYQTEYWIATVVPLTGILICYLAHKFYNGSIFCLNLIAVNLMVLSATMIHLGKGTVEYHFHIFGILGLTYLYGYYSPLLSAAVTIAVHHILFFLILPTSLLNYQASIYIVILHAAFVIGQTCIGLFVVKNFGRFVEIQSNVLPKLKAVVNENQKLSFEIKKSSDLYSGTSSEQASAVQETVATLHQLTAMVQKTNDNVKNSTQLSKSSYEQASESLNAVDKMLKSMNEIDEAIQSIITQTQNTNSQVSEIADVIKNISEKTKVINDIVFQTRLLSFNASVEAARAGEHGKGFAVVAEEVGNLAGMSGKASQEIEKLLSESSSRVNDIIKESDLKINSTSQTGKNKIANGQDLAKYCHEIINSVVSNIEIVSNNMNDIAQASQEQSQGISNINDAMGELDRGAHLNSDSARSSANMAEQLLVQVQKLNDIIQSMNNTNEAA